MGPHKEWGRGARLVDARSEGFSVPTQVNYVGLGGQLYTPGQQVDGSASVALSMLRTGHLWEQVRVIGGAYGAMCSFGRSSGTMAMVSYRDPNLDSTLDVYFNTGKALMEISQHLTDEDLELAVIGTIGGMDSPMSPRSKGAASMRQWLAKEPAQARQTFRDQVINTSRDDLYSFGQQMDATMGAQADTIKTVVGSQTAFDSAKVGLDVKTI